MRSRPRAVTVPLYALPLAQALDLLVQGEARAEVEHIARLALQVAGTLRELLQGRKWYLCRTLFLHRAGLWAAARWSLRRSADAASLHDLHSR